MMIGVTLLRAAILASSLSFHREADVYYISDLHVFPATNQDARFLYDASNYEKATFFFLNPQIYPRDKRNS